MTKQKPKVPPSNIPILGQTAGKERDVALVNTILAQIDPVMQKILEGIDGLERRVEITERMVDATFVDIISKEVENKLGLKFKFKQYGSDYDPVEEFNKEEREKK